MWTNFPFTITWALAWIGTNGGTTGRAWLRVARANVGHVFPLLSYRAQFPSFNTSNKQKTQKHEARRGKNFGNGRRYPGEGRLFSFNNNRKNVLYLN